LKGAHEGSAGSAGGGVGTAVASAGFLQKASLLLLSSLSFLCIFGPWFLVYRDGFRFLIWRERERGRDTERERETERGVKRRVKVLWEFSLFLIHFEVEKEKENRGKLK